MEDTPEPEAGNDWLRIVTSKTVEEFARAFTTEPVLEASVLTTPMVGVAAIRTFFQATRGMYERIAFTRESRSGRQIYLEWAGEYRGRPVVGTTILIGDAAMRSSAFASSTCPLTNSWPLHAISIAG